jgi:hypothetical protein
VISGQLIKPEEDDLSGLAGWMYTDLLVGLMVIFLATITFVPEGNFFKSRTTPGSENTVYSYSRVVKDPLSLLIENEQLPDIPTIIKDFLEQKNLAPDSNVVYVQIVGSYNEKLETPEQAVSRALSLSQKLEKAYPELIKAASTTFSRTTSIPTNQVVLRFVFAEKVTVGQ